MNGSDLPGALPNRRIDPGDPHPAGIGNAIPFRRQDGNMWSHVRRGCLKCGCGQMPRNVSPCCLKADGRLAKRRKGRTAEFRCGWVKLVNLVEA